MFLTNCQNPSVNSQTKTKNSAEIKINMNNKIETLADLKWQNRIILVKEKESRGLTQLREKTEEIKDRDIIWFSLKDGKIETNFDGDLPQNFAAYLYKEYFEKFEKSVFLIGKDGTIKSKNDELDLKDYFRQIDSMPMRQREMRESS